MIYTSTTQFNIFLERKHEIHLLFTLYKKKLAFKSTTILMPFRRNKSNWTHWFQRENKEKKKVKKHGRGK